MTTLQHGAWTNAGDGFGYEQLVMEGQPRYGHVSSISFGQGMPDVFFFLSLMFCVVATPLSACTVASPASARQAKNANLVWLGPEQGEALLSLPALDWPKYVNGAVHRRAGLPTEANALVVLKQAEPDEAIVGYARLWIPQNAAAMTTTDSNERRMALALGAQLMFELRARDDVAAAAIVARLAEALRSLGADSRLGFGRLSFRVADEQHAWWHGLAEGINTRRSPKEARTRLQCETRSEGEGEICTLGAWCGVSEHDPVYFYGTPLKLRGLGRGVDMLAMGQSDSATLVFPNRYGERVLETRNQDLAKLRRFGWPVPSDIVLGPPVGGEALCGKWERYLANSKTDRHYWQTLVDLGTEAKRTAESALRQMYAVLTKAGPVPLPLDFQMAVFKDGRVVVPDPGRILHVSSEHHPDNTYWYDHEDALARVCQSHACVRPARASNWPKCSSAWKCPE